MNKPKKSWWERNVEDVAWQNDDRERELLYKNDPIGRAKHDVQTGIKKGIYYGAKSMVTGVVDLAKWSILTQFGDPETTKKNAQMAKSAWNFAKDIFNHQFGSPDEQKEIQAKYGQYADAALDQIGAAIERDWTKAGKDGKRTELVAHWISRGVFEIAGMFVGVGELKAVSQGAKVLDAASDLSKVKKIGDTVQDCSKSIKKLDDGLDDLFVDPEIPPHQIEAWKRANEVTKPNAKPLPLDADDITQPGVKPAPLDDKPKAIAGSDEVTTPNAVAPKKAPTPEIGIPDEAVQPGDLIFGLYDKKPKRMPFWAREKGAKIATDFDVNKLPGRPRGGKEIGPAVLEEAINTKKQVRFDLNGVDVKQALSGKGPNSNSATSLEIRHMRDNWKRFDPKPKFYKNGSEVDPPWM